MSKYIALDTETMRGKAFLLSYAEGVYEIHSFVDFLDALRRLVPEGRKTQDFVWFNLDYDATGLLKHLPASFLRLFFVRGFGNLNGCSMEYLRGKYWKISWKGYIFHHYDVFPFFQMSLERACRKYLGEGEGKANVSLRALKSLTWRKYRKRRTHWNQYAMQDARLLQRLVNELGVSLSSIGHESRNLYSPGYVAKQFLKRNHVGFGWLSPEVERFVSRCYHGACVEVYQRGFFPCAWSYDLKSAYPAAIAALPDFETASYYFSPLPETSRFFAEVRVSMPKTDFYLLPHVNQGIVRFPQFTGQRAWITQDEYRLLLREGADVKFVRVLNVVADENSRPYHDFVVDIFRLRQNPGMDGLVLKLILNSMYGIAAETVETYRPLSALQAMQRLQAEAAQLSIQNFVLSQATFCPQARWYWLRECGCDICEDTRNFVKSQRGMRRSRGFVFDFGGDFYSVRRKGGGMRNLAVAASITAAVRCRIFEVKKLVPPGSLVSCFTDGVKTLRPLPSKYLGNELGDLGLEVDGRHLLMIGCGVYEHGDIVKVRGYHFKESLVSLFSRQARYRLVRVPTTERISGIMYSTDKFGSLDELNTIVECGRSLNINFDTKRAWPRSWKNAGEMLQGSQMSLPLDFGA